MDAQDPMGQHNQQPQDSSPQGRHAGAATMKNSMEFP